MNKVVALIPLRGGSKSIPNKNIKNFNGKPLFLWTLEAAYYSQVFDEIWISTEDGAIKELSRACDIPVKVLDRPESLATDDASTESVMMHFANKVHFDILCLLQATSPLTTADDIILAYKKFMTEQSDSMFTGVKDFSFLWSQKACPLNYDPSSRPRRQDCDFYIRENGAFYFTRRPILLKEKSRLGGKISYYLMKKETAVEIDEPEDWPMVESFLKSQIKQEQ